MENWKVVMITPKTFISLRGNLVLTGVVGFYEIVTIAKGSFYPFPDIVLHLN